MLRNKLSTINLFCQVDDFCKNFLPFWERHLITSGIRTRNRDTSLSISEIITILILFHNSRCKDFSSFYNRTARHFLSSYFPKLTSYNRFLEIERRALVPLLAFLQHNKGKKTEVYYVDSTSLSVCRNQRIYRHKTFKGIAKRGKTSMGWFYGFKLHIIANSVGELMSFQITRGNVHDSKPVAKLARSLKGKLFGDKGYLGKKLKEKLAKQGLDIITKVRANMKKKQEQFLSKSDKLLLSKRGIIETIIGQIKEMTNIATTKIKNKFNYFVNLVSALVFYQLKTDKPSLGLAGLEEVEMIA